MHAHKGAILDLHFGQDGEHIFTGSSDNTVGMFDFATGTRVKRMKGFLFLIFENWFKF